jgi:hypothetical protein
MRGILFLVLSPVLIPIALLLHSRDQKRMRSLVETFACLSCGRILGADALRLADERWAKHLNDLARHYEGAGIRYRVVRNFDAICPHCGAYHAFIPKQRTFVLARPEDIQPTEEKRPDPP